MPKPVKPNGSGSIVMAYSLPNITSKGLLGEYNFSFDSAKIKDSIQNLQVGVMVDSDYYLKDAAGAINYQSREVSPVMAPLAAAMDSSKGISNPQFDQFYSQVGQGTVVKYEKNIMPNESYNIKGTYADNRAKLYAKEIGTATGVVALVLLLAFGSLFVAVKKVFGKKTVSSDQPAPVKSTTYIAVISASFGSSLLILLYTIGLYVFSVFFTQMFQYYSYNSMYPLMMILVLVISLCVYSVFLFSPAVVIGIKKGLMPGLSALVLTIFWLIMESVIVIGIIFIFFQSTYNPSYPIPLPMMGMEKSAVGTAVVAPDVKY